MIINEAQITPKRPIIKRLLPKKKISHDIHIGNIWYNCIVTIVIKGDRITKLVSYKSIVTTLSDCNKPNYSNEVQRDHEIHNQYRI